MKVQITFELDLQKLYDDNRKDYILRDMSFQDMVEELREMFGTNFERMSKDAYLSYINDFVQLFNY